MSQPLPRTLLGEVGILRTITHNFNIIWSVRAIALNGDSAGLRGQINFIVNFAHARTYTTPLAVRLKPASGSSVPRIEKCKPNLNSYHF